MGGLVASAVFSQDAPEFRSHVDLVAIPCAVVDAAGSPGLAPSECSAFGANYAVASVAIVALTPLILPQPGPNSWFFKKRLNASPATFSRKAYFSKPRIYGMTGGRGPVLKSGPRVER